MTQPAVIYCRVSSNAQVKKGDGLQSQETRCREYTRHKGYGVIEVFKDEAVSGGMINRPGMQAMLKFLRKIRHKQPVVIIDDISRLARGLQAHLDHRLSNLVKIPIACWSKIYWPAYRNMHGKRMQSR